MMHPVPTINDTGRELIFCDLAMLCVSQQFSILAAP